MKSEEYETYGTEWKAEIKKLPKDQIIMIFSQLGKEKEELQQATKELKEALQFVVDGVVFSDDGRIWTHWLETFQELLTKYKDL